MDTVRAFIAVDISHETRDKLDALQRTLKAVHADVRWVKPQNMHLTLAFLDHLSIQQISAVKTALDQACQDVISFELETAGTGFFGSPDRPRVIWAGVSDCHPLMELQQHVVEALLESDVEVDNRPFSPHLTLGRIKSPNHTDSLLVKLESYRQEPLGKTHIDAVKLFQSELKPHGAEYTVLHRVPLSAAGIA